MAWLDNIYAFIEYKQIRYGVYKWNKKQDIVLAA
jgi:hypothetical protein